MRRSLLRRGLALAGALACSISVSALAAPAATATHPTFGKWGVDLDAMDKSVKPGDDFFTYINGAWLKTAQIPPDRSSTGSFQDLQILSEKRMRAIVDDLEAKPYAKLSDDEKKLRDLYDAFEDQKAIEANGLKPVQADLAYLDGLKTLNDVARAMGSVRLGTTSIYDSEIGVDEKNPNAYAIDLYQSGLGMPDRDYYLRDDKEIVATRDAYKKYLAQMLTLAGKSDAAKRAEAIFKLETGIAKVSWAAADRRDEDKIYNPMTIAQLKKLAPQFDWDAFFGEMGVTTNSPKGARVVVVAEKSAFPAIAKVFAATPVSVWRDYLTVHYLHHMSPYLPKKFDDADFAFYGVALTGRSQQLDRATRGVHLLDAELGEALGKIYVARYFPPASKAKAEELVGNLLKAYDADIRTIDWMTDATKQKALEKLHKFTPHIGYPDKWRDYSAFAVSKDNLVGDIQNGAVFEWNRQLKRIDQPVDKDEWGMTPPTINAYYFPPFNEIVFPAAILQPPFFDPNADDAVNYGGIGAVIGHEISHGFDDQGAKYDGDGVLHNWWTPADLKNFKAKTDALVAQYDTYVPLPGLHVNGRLTLGENIGDLSGVTIAYKAYHLSLNGKPAPVIDGYTGDQRFFLGFGQIWRAKLRDGALRAQVLSNPHSPPQFRADGSTRNVDAWYDAMDVKPGDKYYLPPEKRVRLW